MDVCGACGLWRSLDGWGTEQGVVGGSRVGVVSVVVRRAEASVGRVVWCVCLDRAACVAVGGRLWELCGFSSCGRDFAVGRTGFGTSGWRIGRTESRKLEMFRCLNKALCLFLLLEVFCQCSVLLVFY